MKPNAPLLARPATLPNRVSRSRRSSSEEFPKKSKMRRSKHTSKRLILHLPHSLHSFSSFSCRYDCGNGKSLVISVIHFWKFCAGVSVSCHRSRNQVFPGVLHVLLSNTLSLLFSKFFVLFLKFGPVTTVTRSTDKETGKRKRFAFVEFDDYDPVDKAIIKVFIIKPSIM